MKGVGRIAANAISLWFVATDFRTIYNSRNYSPSDFTALFAPFHYIHITFNNNKYSTTNEAPSGLEPPTSASILAALYLLS